MKFFNFSTYIQNWTAIKFEHRKNNSLQNVLYLMTSSSHLISELLCPSILLNADLVFGCTRRIGEACKFICKENYIPILSENIVCSKQGVWKLENSTEVCTSKTIRL